MMLPRGLLVAYLLHLSSKCLCQEVETHPMDGVTGPSENKAQEKLRELLKKYDPFTLPFIPTLAFNPRKDIDVAISFTNISLEGLSTELNVDSLNIPDPLSAKSKIKIRFAKLTMRANRYVAGGSIINLPFTGKSCARGQLEDLIISMDMKASIDYKHHKFCITENTTHLELGIRKAEVYFDNLNPGTDQGELINTVFSGLIPDIIDFVQQKYNGEWHDKLDPFVVSMVNSKLCKSSDN